VQSSYKAVGVVASGTTGYTYSSSKGMVAGSKVTAGNWKTLTKGIINGKTYYSISKDGKATYAWVPAANIKFGVTSSSTSSTPAKMTQSSYKAVGTVSSSAKTYYYTSKGMITGPKVAAGNWKTLTKGVYNGNTYYLVSKNGKTGYAWVLASGIKFGVKSTPAAMKQSSYKAIGTVSSSAKTYYYTSKGMIAGPKVAAGNWKTLTKGVYNGNTYYLVSKNGKTGYAWVLASGIKFGLK
jgi:bifunctional autolysin